MRNRERARGDRLWRAVMIVVGVLAGVVSFDAILLFVVLLLAPIFFGPVNPYIGLLVALVLPAVAIVGGVVAWTAFAVLNDRAPESPADGHHAAV